MKKQKLVLILLVIIFVLVMMLLFYGFYYFNNIQNMIKMGNTIVEDYCEKKSLEKHFGLINIYKWDRFIGLKYLIYDNEIYEVYIAFNKNNFKWEGDSIEVIKNFNGEYIQKHYPFLTKYLNNQ